MITFIAHRGTISKDYPGNSKEGLLSAINDPTVSGIELDVRMTKDKKIIVFHNLLIDDKKNPIRRISNITVKQLKKYDIDTSKKYIIKVPLLKEVLDHIHSNKKILIEIKEESKEYQETVRQIYRVIKKYPELNIYICSFHKELLLYFKKKYPNYRVGLIIGMFQNLDDLYNSFDFVSITTTVMEHWNFSKETFIWTINNVAELKKIQKKTNQVGIITDKTYLLNDYLLDQH